MGTTAYPLRTAAIFCTLAYGVLCYEIFLAISGYEVLGRFLLYAMASLILFLVLLIVAPSLPAGRFRSVVTATAIAAIGIGAWFSCTNKLAELAFSFYRPSFERLIASARRGERLRARIGPFSILGVSVDRGYPNAYVVVTRVEGGSTGFLYRGSAAAGWEFWQEDQERPLDLQ